jgi:CheY-like chemotaxis protein
MFSQPHELCSRCTVAIRRNQEWTGVGRLPMRKRPVVLIVEDEVLIRMGALAMVHNAGFEALQAANADDAIKILEARDDIRVVFTDINMPGSMDGLKLAAAVRDRWPPIEFIVTSGHRAPATDDLPERARFIDKPYSDSQVIRALTELTA